MKVKNANSGQLFRPDWVSSAEYAAQNRTTNVETVVYKVLAGNGDPNGLKFESRPIDNSRVTIYYSIGQEFEISCRCLDKESEDSQNYPYTENMDNTM